MSLDTLKDDVNELFDRVRILETKQAVSAERDKALMDKMDNLMDFFKTHDRQEMSKYGEVSKEIMTLKRFMYITTGVIGVIMFIKLDGIKALLGG